MQIYIHIFLSLEVRFRFQLTAFIIFAAGYGFQPGAS
jgi:hypothetical protein